MIELDFDVLDVAQTGVGRDQAEKARTVDRRGLSKNEVVRRFRLEPSRTGLFRSRTNAPVWTASAERKRHRIDRAAQTGQ